jgi:DEAD/DEAH box helicase domain-containing protein
VPVDAVADALSFLAEHQVVQPVTSAKGKRAVPLGGRRLPGQQRVLRSVAGTTSSSSTWTRDKTIAEMDWRSTHTMLHEQAIYQHDGEQYQVERWTSRTTRPSCARSARLLHHGA